MSGEEAIDVIMEPPGEPLDLNEQLLNHPLKRQRKHVGTRKTSEVQAQMYIYYTIKGYLQIKSITAQNQSIFRALFDDEIIDLIHK